VSGISIGEFFVWLVIVTTMVAIAWQSCDSAFGQRGEMAGAKPSALRSAEVSPAAWKQTLRTLER
jgi:hypothetical protein